MTGPVASLGPRHQPPPPNETLQSNGWEDFKRLMNPAQMQNPFRPDGKILQEIARYSETVEGREVIAWLRSITDQAPYPNVSGGNFEQVAIAAAKHDARATIGRMIAAAISEGTAITNQQRG